MRAYRTTKKSGFTLVEILIVVIILGILAAIVIPQFTNASQDARKSSLVSQLQTIRSQVELYTLQHRNAYPTGASAVGGALTDTWNWDKMTGKSDDTGDLAATSPQFGPYLQANPANPINDNTVTDPTSVTYVATDPAFNDPVGTACGWVVSQSTGKVYATTKTGKFIYDEGNPADPVNDQ